MTAQTVQVDDLHLIALPSAVNCGDMFVQFTLTEWSLRPLRDEATDTARELLAAAVASADPEAPSVLTLRLRLRGDCLVVEVEDPRPAKSITIPASLSLRRTGIDRVGSQGQMAWCELPLPPGMSAPAVALPRRERRRSPAAEQLADEPAEVDPAVIQQLLTGLSRGHDQQS